ncbi:MAG: hypothetical protein ABL888_03310 [Pirellulaceae bacterium]
MLAPTVFAVDSGDRLFKVDASSGSVQIVGQMGVTMYDIAFDPTGNLYGVGSGSKLYRINEHTAQATLIGSIGSVVNSLVFSHSGVLYAAGSSLVRINVATGAGTSIGNFNGFASAGDLAFDATGNLFMSSTSNQLFKLNPTDGSASLIGSLGYSQVFGLVFGADNVMYGLSNSTQQVFSIDLNSGAGTLKSNFGGQGAIGVNGGASRTEAMRDIRMQVIDAFTADGKTNITLAYQITGGPVPAFEMGFYQSSDTLFGNDIALDSVLISDPADLTDGPHVKSFSIGTGPNQISLPGAGSPEINQEYFLLAVADPNNNLVETDATPQIEDNTATFVGVYHLPSNEIFVHGGLGNDLVVVDQSLAINFNGVSLNGYNPSSVTGLRIRGHAGNDTINGQTSNKPMWISGDADNDELFGGSNNDTFIFNADLPSGDDVVRDSSGFDKIDFSIGLQKVTLDFGLNTTQLVSPNLILTLAPSTIIESVNGTRGNDIFYGNDAPNRMSGGGGNDILEGRGGDDELLGGAGSDRYWFDADTSLGSDKILNESGGFDLLDFQATSTKAISINLGIAATQTVVPGVLNLNLGSATWIEGVRGGSFNDVITGNGLSNLLLGMAGSDQISGLGGRDLIIGGLGADLLSGGESDDLLIAGTTSYDENISSLLLVRTEWDSANIYTQRVANIRGLSGFSVITDGHVDQLTGNAGRDWFFGLFSEVSDKSADEQLN